MTDNITPQVPQTKAPMATDEIIQHLGRIRAVYPMALGNALGEEETAAGMEALTAAIQAVELLEEIKAELRGECSGCKHDNCPKTAYPCYTCLHEGRDHWEFRWPLGEEGDHENK